MRVLLAALLASWAVPASAQVSEARIRADMALLTADDMEGRRPGTRGERRAVRAIVTMFKAAGLEPAGERGWVQRVALEERKPLRLRLSQRGGSDLSGEVMLVGERGRMRLEGAPVRFMNDDGVVPHAPGAVLIYREPPAPAALTPDTDEFVWRERLAASGAVAALAIVDGPLMARHRQRMPLGTIEASGAARPPIRGFITEAAAKALMAGGAVLDGEVVTRVRRFESANVIGRLRGAVEPERALVFSAHWDAFGLCRPGEADAVCNGGIDNASGVAGMVELARLFAKGPRPDRSIVFVATTAEEHRLLGMRAYAARPAVPLANTVASINVDTIALYPAGHPVGYVGGGLTSLDPLIAKLVAAQGRTLDTGAGPGFVARSSDAWPMLRAGVPAVILSNVIARTGPDKGAAFRRFTTERAHLPNDDMRDIDLMGAVQDLELMQALAGELVRRGSWPDFLPGAAFSRPRSARRSAGN